MRVAPAPSPPPIARLAPRHPVLGRWGGALSEAVMGVVYRMAGLPTPSARTTRRWERAFQDRLATGEEVLLLGCGIAGHNTGVALVGVSAERGVTLYANHEEERYAAIKHYGGFPEQSLRAASRSIVEIGRSTADLFACICTWDYPAGIGLTVRSALEEAPTGLHLLRPSATPKANATHAWGALGGARRLRRALGRPDIPVFGSPHHDNHAYFSWAVSPFGRDGGRTLVLVSDGYGDRGSISIYLAEDHVLRQVWCNDAVFDSLGLFYAVLSSTQGGWTTLSSEGRYMGAAAWGDASRETNPWYRRLRDVFALEADGRVRLNRTLANWPRMGEIRPYTDGLTALIGEPVPPEKMWNPDAILSVDDIQHSPVTQERVDKAAAVQLVFEDALFHVLEHWLTVTRCSRVVLTGGTALNCVANMRLFDHFDERFFERRFGESRRRLELWVPPTPGDAGVTMGAACAFALKHGARPGRPLEHAFLCGNAPKEAEILAALRARPDVGAIPIGDVRSGEGLDAVADLMAFLVSKDAIIAIFQGAAETGPRALGHRSILANPCNALARDQLNSKVKFRERIRPLAPMVTLHAAERLFQMEEGAGADNGNAYNWMVLTCRATDEARLLIPAVVHQDGTARIQIVRHETDPLMFAYLQALGRHIGVEASINTSLNVGAPIAQSPEHALDTMRRSLGMDALFLVASEGPVYVAWQRVVAPPKDDGARLQLWLSEWRAQRGGARSEVQGPVEAPACPPVPPRPPG